MPTKTFLLVFIILFSLKTAVYAQKSTILESKAQKENRMAWWTNDRFGMFIHWGLYASPARHEWVKRRENLNNEQYQKYFDIFNPDHFDPKKWAAQAKAAGMKYAVLTTKHHEGFCLFDSKFTDYKATNTQAKRDLVKEFVNAFRTQGIKIGFYYSLLDWHHPDYIIDRAHPLAPKDKSDSAYATLNKGRDMAKYRLYLRNQITELLTNYGEIDILWLDFSFGKAKDGPGKGKDDWGSVELLKLIKKLQPEIIVNNRLGLSTEADFVTPEQLKPAELLKFKKQTWETCQTFAGSWGYYRDENKWKTHRQLLDLLITSVSNGGNLILNVGPTARGEFDYRAINALDSLGYWMHANDRSIYGCNFAPDQFNVPDQDKLTYNAAKKTLYLHLFQYPSDGKITLTGYKGKIKYAQFLHDASEIKITEVGSAPNDLVLTLPLLKPKYEIPVIELSIK